MKQITVICDFCGNEFIRSLKVINERNHKGYDKQFCCVQCSASYKKRGKTVNCHTCGKSIYVTNDRLNGNFNFCSNACSSHKIDLSKFDWVKIQNDHDNGIYWRNLPKHIGMSRPLLNRAYIEGYIKKMLHKRTWSDDDRKRISVQRLDYLTKHPDQVPYLMNHSSKMSYPENTFKNALESSGITGWRYNYQNGMYQYDFAFPDLKIDVEIDGRTHLLENIKKIDMRRDEFSIKSGWIVIRFTAKDVKANVIDCINKLKQYLSD